FAQFRHHHLRNVAQDCEYQLGATGVQRCARFGDLSIPSVPAPSDSCATCADGRPSRSTDGPSTATTSDVGGIEDLPRTSIAPATDGGGGNRRISQGGFHPLGVHE